MMELLNWQSRESWECEGEKREWREMLHLPPSSQGHQVRSAAFAVIKIEHTFLFLLYLIWWKSTIRYLLQRVE